MRCSLIYLLLVAITVTALTSCGNSKDKAVISIAFYNCENLFDTIHNADKDDLEFTPGGAYHYTQRIYEQKLHNIATVLQSMEGVNGPAIIGLAEVENSTVLNDLIRQPELARRNYKYEWFDGPDPRGINVAMLYDPAVFSVIRSERRHVDLLGTEGKTLTRDILHVFGVLSGDTVHIFVNHWPSRVGGAEESEPKRVIAAATLRKAIMQILQMQPESKIMLLGDFNDNPSDSSITGILGAKSEQAAVPDSGLYDPFVSIYKSGGGTEEYRHTWNLFDQIIVSGAYLSDKNHKWQYDRAEIYKPDFLVSHAKGHEGAPRRSFAGPHWINGYSDHFPVLVYLRK